MNYSDQISWMYDEEFLWNERFDLDLGELEIRHSEFDGLGLYSKYCCVLSKTNKFQHGPYICKALKGDNLECYEFCLRSISKFKIKYKKSGWNSKDYAILHINDILLD